MAIPITIEQFFLAKKEVVYKMKGLLRGERSTGLRNAQNLRVSFTKRIYSF